MYAMPLQERANAFMENVRPFCPFETEPLYFERFIVTVKPNEMVAWPFECLICERSDCPLAKVKKKADLDAA